MVWFFAILCLMLTVCPVVLCSEIAIKFEPNVTREYIESFAKSHGCRVTKVRSEWQQVSKCQEKVTIPNENF